MYTEKDFDTTKKIIFKHVAKVKSIILFGSYARGTAGKESDLDILVLTEKNYDRENRLKTLTNLRWDISLSGINADVLIKNHTDYINDTRLPTIAKTISREGKILWKKN